METMNADDLANGGDHRHFNVTLKSLCFSGLR